MTIKWPYLAQGDDGQLYTPLEAKQKRQNYYLRLQPEVQLTPVVGLVMTPHWRSPSELDYQSIRGGYEMGDWHYQQQITAKEELGHQLEYRLIIDGKTYYADSYDTKTNTIYEYVDTHYDNFKISIYFCAGYNQVWVFRTDGSDYRLALESDLSSIKLSTPALQEVQKHYLSALPTITIIKDQE
jgi:hypothetical protein